MKRTEWMVYGLVALCICAADAACGAAESGLVWKAGVSRVKITPVEKVWMAGYGSRTNAAVGAYHDLWAKALAIEDRAVEAVGF